MSTNNLVRQLRNYRVALGTLILLLVAAITVSAQNPTAVILGTVKDASGGTVAGATVTVMSTDTGLSRSQPTGDDGAYRFNALPVGNWTVNVMKDGFQTYQRTGLNLVIGQEAVIDVVLQVGATGQTVTVTGEAPVVDTTSSTLGGVVDEVKVEDLPLNGRNFVDLTLLQPGVVQTSQVSGPYGTSGTAYSSNGATLRSNAITLDGANMTTLLGVNNASAIQTTLGIDGIKEYKVVTSQFSAEYGLTMGRQTVIVSKGGENQWHGGVFEYLRNDKLDAKNYFDTVDHANARGLTCDANGDKLLAFPCQRIPPYKRNNFGGSFGGPIKKDKTFFYGTYEGLRERFSPTTTATTFPIGCFVGPMNGSAGGADKLFSTVPSVIDNNPATNPYDTNIGGTLTACTKPTSTNQNLITVGGGNATTQAQILQLASLWPQPLPGLGGVPPGFTPAPGLTTITAIQQPPTGFNYQFPFVQPSREDYEQLRLDEDLNAKDSAFLRYTVDWSNQHPQGTFPQWYNQNRSLSAIGTAGETHIVSPTVLNQARVSFSRTDLVFGIATFQDPGTYKMPVASAGVLIPGRDASTSIATGSGTSAITSFGTAGNSSPNTAGDVAQNIWQFSDDVYWNKGKHAFKFGTLIDHYTGLFRVTFQYRGTLAFPSLDSFFAGQYSSVSAPTIGGGGAPIPAYIQNGTNGFGNFSPQDRQYWWNTMGFYVQDDYRVLPRVTLNLGLRYEFMTLPQAPPGLSYTVLNPSVPVPCTIPTGSFGCTGPANGQGTPASLWGVNNSKHNFSPRIGFAWDVFGDGKMAIRGGGAIMYDIADVGTSIAGNATGDPSLSGLETITLTYPKAAFLGALPIPLSIAGLPNGASCAGAFQFTPNCPANSFQNLGGLPCTPITGSLAASPFCVAGGNITVALTSRVADYQPQQPTMGEWNLTLDRQLPAQIDLTVSYVGTKGWHILNTTEANPTTATGIGANGLPFYCTATAGLAVEATASTPCTTNTLNPRPNLNLGPTQYYTAGADSNYQGLQVGLNKRLANGLQFQMAYTYSKLLDDGEKTNGDANSSPSDGQTVCSGVLKTTTGTPVPCTNFVDRGRAFVDATHNLRLNVIYHIPDLKTDHFYGGFIHGWWLGDITSFQTGFPINITDGTDRSLTSNQNASGSRPNLDPSFNAGTVVTGNHNAWFNTTMFDLNPPGTFGNAPRDFIVGPNLSNTDLSISKDTRLKWLGEAGNLEIRAEMFDVFNHPSFLAPSGSIGWSSKTPGTDLSAAAGNPNGQFKDTRFPASSPANGPAASGSAGAITATTIRPRNIQLSAKIIF